MTTEPIPLPNWMEYYRHAMMELDQAKLSQLLDVAINAVLDRIEEIRQSSEELDDLNDALNRLRSRRKEVNGVTGRGLDEPKAA